MVPAIEISLVLAAAFYLSVHIGLVTGIKRLDDSKTLVRPFISIIVAARNEEQHIDQLLQCLVHQSYSNNEIIIVNDRSTDKTAELIAAYQRHHSNIKRIDISHVPEDMPAKKNALRAGIESSRGDILCFTDADCFPPPHWIEELVKSFTPNTGLVAGYSPYLVPQDRTAHTGIIPSLFYQFIGYEEFRAAIWSAGSIGWNLGWLCTGRNLAYRRAVYDEVNGFERIKMSISGDDDLFLQVVRRQTSWKIKYLTSKKSFVPTVPPMSPINAGLITCCR